MCNQWTNQSFGSLEGVVQESFKLWKLWKPTIESEEDNGYEAEGEEDEGPPELTFQERPDIYLTLLNVGKHLGKILYLQNW